MILWWSPGPVKNNSLVWTLHGAPLCSGGENDKVRHEERYSFVEGEIEIMPVRHHERHSLTLLGDEPRQEISQSWDAQKSLRQYSRCLVRKGDDHHGASSNGKEEAADCRLDFKSRVGNSSDNLFQVDNYSILLVLFTSMVESRSRTRLSSLLLATTHQHCCLSSVSKLLYGVRYYSIISTQTETKIHIIISFPTNPIDQNEPNQRYTDCL